MSDGEKRRGDAVPFVIGENHVGIAKTTRGGLVERLHNLKTARAVAERAGDPFGDPVEVHLTKNDIYPVLGELVESVW